jgi:hypothetical protein
MHNAIPLILALLVLGLICGSEFNVAAFGHPALNRQPLETHIRIRSSMAALFGHVMPFWMVGSTLLNLALILPFGPRLARRRYWLRHPGLDECLFPVRPSPHQQPHH